MFSYISKVIYLFLNALLFVFLKIFFEILYVLKNINLQAPIRMIKFDLGLKLLEENFRLSASWLVRLKHHGFIFIWVTILLWLSKNLTIEFCIRLTKIFHLSLRHFPYIRNIYETLQFFAFSRCPIYLMLILLLRINFFHKSCG